MDKIRTLVNKVLSFRIKVPKVNAFRSKAAYTLGTTILWTPKKIGWVLRKLLHGIVIGPGFVFSKVIKSPKKAFRKAKDMNEILIIL